MADLLKGIAAFLLVIVATQLGSLVWRLYRMPYWVQRELQENYERRKQTERMLRFWLSGGKRG